MRIVKGFAEFERGGSNQQKAEAVTSAPPS